jgi:spore germination cell wall hydrolase CwlJ-like protein
VRLLTLSSSADHKLASAVAFALWAVAVVVIGADIVAQSDDVEDAALRPAATALTVANTTVVEADAMEVAHLDIGAAAADLDKQSNCLATAIYHEARSERYLGQVGVAEVIMNRVASRAFPDSVCGVVYQGSNRKIGCQFSFTCDGSLDRGQRGRAWRRAQKLADRVVLGMDEELTDRATHYHADYVAPRWARNLVKTAEIGRHIFYRPAVKSASIAQ